MIMSGIYLFCIGIGMFWGQKLFERTLDMNKPTQLMF